MRQEFETKLVPQDIVVRQTDEKDVNIENNAGLWFPLIRVKDVVFHMDKIESLKYTVGKSLLPKITVVINDDDREFSEEQFPNIDDLITVRISNNNDTEHKPIKNDYSIIKVNSSPNTRLITIVAIHHIPTLHKYNNKSWNMSLFEVTKEIAKECDLGFITNINQSNDESNWICPRNYYDYLSYISERMELENDDVCKIFIDAFNNLNVISLRTAFDNRSPTQLLTNPVTGDKYDESIDVILSNKDYKDEDNNRVTINSWSPTTNYGEGFLKNKKITNYNQKVDERHIKSNLESFTIENINALDDSKENVFSTYVDSDTVSRNILTTRKRNKKLRSIYGQGTYVKSILDYFIYDIYPMMYVYSELYNKSRNSSLNSQDENIDIDELSEMKPKYKTNGAELNEEFTGDYIVVDVTYSFIKSNNRDNQIIHSLNMIKV